jgi:maltooligosyltrehalose trehalohydrolase
MKCCHNMPFGATVLDGEGVQFKLWAPGVKQVQLCLYQPDGEHMLSMEPAGDGWFELTMADAKAGSRYHFCINDNRVPDPASRSQPEDVHGPSVVVDPGLFDWQDETWTGRL